MSPYVLRQGRLGHISQKRTKKLAKNGILLYHPDSSKNCVECVKGKLTKTKRNASKHGLNLLELFILIFVNLFLMQL